MLHTIKHSNTRRSTLITVLVFLVFVGVPLFAAYAAPAEPELPNTIEGFIYWLATTIGGAFLLLGGYLLDQAVNMLVIGMGDYLAGGMGVAVDTLWVVIRDTFNILFIFGLIYIGFRTILNSGDTNTKRALVLLVVAALLINFSLFITKAIVDFTNVTAFQIYMATTEPSAAVQAGTGARSDIRNITEPFMDAFALTSYADGAYASQFEDQATYGRLATFGIVMMFVMIIAGFVFAAGAFMMLGRFIALIIFMILSPAMFLGFIFPLFAKYQREWWDKFLRYAFVAPAYLFMLYLSLVAISKLALGGSFKDAWLAESFLNGVAVIFVNFFIIAGFLIASVVVARQIGVYGAAGSVNLMQKGGNYIRTRAQGAAGRQTVGRAAQFGQWANNKLERSKGGRFTKGLLSAASLGTFDEQARRETFKKGMEANFGSSRSLQGNIDFKRDRNRNISALEAEKKRENSITDGLKEAERVANTPGAAPTGQTLNNLEKAIRNLTDKQLTEDVSFKQLTNKHFAIHLNNKQIEALEKSGKYSDAQIQQIKDKRKSGFIDIAQQNTAAGSAFNAERNREWLGRKGTDEMAKMPEEVFTEPGMAPHLTPAAVEAKIKDGSLLKDLPKVRANIDNQIAMDRANTPKGQGGAYTKQWKNWVERNPHGPRLGLQNV